MVVGAESQDVVAWHLPMCPRVTKGNRCEPPLNRSQKRLLARLRSAPLLTKRLASAVIGHAMKDLSSQNRLLALDASIFLLGGGRWFYHLCRAADMSVGTVIKEANAKRSLELRVTHWIYDSLRRNPKGLTRSYLNELFHPTEIGKCLQTLEAAGGITQHQQGRGVRWEAVGQLPKPKRKQVKYGTKGGMLVRTESTEEEDAYVEKRSRQTGLSTGGYDYAVTQKYREKFKREYERHKEAA